MQRMTMAAGFLLAGALVVSGQAIAQCSGPWLNQTQLANAFSGKTACASRGNDSWQEYHAPGGQLIDYKKGPTDPVDPTKQVGTWSIQGTGGNAKLHYDYGGSDQYDYSVHADGGNTYSLCGAGGQTVTVLSGQVSCGAP